MMYMEDAVQATLALMREPKGSPKIRTSYNISGTSFVPCNIAAEIRKHIPEFKIRDETDSWRRSPRPGLQVSATASPCVIGYGSLCTNFQPDRRNAAKLAELKGMPFKLKADDEDFYSDFPGG